MELKIEISSLLIVLKLKGQPLSIRYNFKHMNGELVAMRSSCYSFQNPYTDEAEYIVCTNNVIKYVTSFRRLLDIHNFFKVSFIEVYVVYVG